MSAEETLSKLRLAIRAVANADGRFAQTYMRELETLVKAMSFLPETEPLARLLQPEIDAGLHVHSFAPQPLSTLDECVRAFVRAEWTTTRVPGHIWAFFHNALVLLLPAKSVPAERLLRLINKQDCGIDSYQSLCAAVDRLNDFRAYPKEVTQERCVRVAEGKLWGEQLCALPAYELLFLAVHIGTLALSRNLTGTEQHQLFRKRCQEFELPEAKRQHTE